MKRHAAFLASLLAAGSATAFAAPASDGTYTFHYDNGRTGWNPHETALTVASVSSKRFGLVGTLATDSVVYAEPLYVPGVRVGGVAHDLVVAVTENDTAYGFDAHSGATLWKHSVLAAKQAPQPISSVNGCNQITPAIGISSTPVVDASAHSLYLVAKFVDSSNGTTYHAQLRSLDLATGRENRPAAEIGGTVTLNNGNGAKHVFTPQWQQQRAALLLDRGVVYIGFGSSCDENASFVSGWMFAYDPHSMKQLALFNTATDYLGSNGYYMDSIWQGTYGPAADDAGGIFFATGNGEFDANVAGGKNYGDTVLHLTPNLHVADWFTPFDQQTLSNNDLDVGSAGVMLVPPAGTGSHRFAVAGGKNGKIFLLDRDHLGGFTRGGPDDVLQEIAGPANSLFGGPAFYDRTVYQGFGGQPLVAYALATSPKPALIPSSPHVRRDRRRHSGDLLKRTQRRKRGAVGDEPRGSGKHVLAARIRRDEPRASALRGNRGHVECPSRRVPHADDRRRSRFRTGRGQRRRGLRSHARAKPREFTAIASSVSGGMP